MCGQTVCFTERLRFPQKRGSDGIALWILRGLCKTAKQKAPQLPIFLSVSCVYLRHLRVHTPDFSWLLPLYFFFCTVFKECTVECHRGNWSPSTPDLSDGIRRQHLVIASFGISSLPFSLRPFVIIFYNRMSNLPLAECRECLSGLVTHTHTLAFILCSADAFPQVCRLQLGPCITVIYLLSRLFDLLYCLCLFPPLSFRVSSEVLCRWNACFPAKVTAKESQSRVRCFLRNLHHVTFLFVVQNQLVCYDAPFPLPPRQPSTPKYALLSETTCWVGPDGLSHCLLHLFEERGFFFFFLGLMFNKTPRREETVKLNVNRWEESLDGTVLFGPGRRDACWHGWIWIPCSLRVIL